LQAGCTIPQVFLVLAIGNVLVAGGMFLLVPDYLRHFAAWVGRLRG
jgi:hypothetical protein